jgi:hypothetical protein
MKRYSLSRKDYIDLLVNKYYRMKEAIYIEWESCSKCMLMKPHIQKRAEKNWYEFQVFRFDDANVKEFQIDSVPMLIIKENDIVEWILKEEDIVNLISNSNKDVSIWQESDD